MLASWSRPCSVHSSAWVLALTSVLVPLVSFTSARAALEGQWTPNEVWGGIGSGKYAVHMVLMPGDDAPYHSRILWYRGENATVFGGGEWGWRTGADGCDAFPSTRFDALAIAPSGVDLFCSGSAALPDGRVFFPGGTHPVTGSYGENKSRILTRGSGTTSSTWSDGGLMNDWRWYPSGTTLRDGRVFVGGGSRHRNQHHFGGRRDGIAPASPSGDLVERFAPVEGGQWDAAVTPDEDPQNGKPDPRESHTFVEMGGVPGFADPSNRPAQVMFGGRDASGAVLFDTWLLTRDDNRLGADYTYHWLKPPLFNGTSPQPRSDHSAVRVASGGTLDMMVVYGGRNDDDTARDDVWRLRRDTGPNFRWSQVTTTGPAPSARLGHAAVYDTSTVFVSGVATARRRMVVFGGTASLAQTPTDQAVYELRFDPATPNDAVWSVMTPADPAAPKPAARYWHSAVTDHRLRTGPQSRLGHATFLFGGALGASQYSAELWILWTFQDGTYGWELRSFTGPAPSARARHSMSYDEDQGLEGNGGYGGTSPGRGRLYIYGGENAAGHVSDRFTRVLDPWPTPAASWLPWTEHDVTLSGHTSSVEHDLTLSRISEVWDLVTNSFQKYPAHPLYWDHTYPLNFAVPGSTTPGGRLLTVGQDRLAYWLDIPAPGQQPPNAWSPPGGVNAAFVPQTAVMYEPGRIMVAGGRESAGPVTGTTKTLDATVANPTGWAPSGSMSPRYFHNLVALPTGQVLAVGGYNTTDQHGHDLAVRHPQIWTPSTGTWTAPTFLAEQPTARGYHSTAILLPDARVLSASGDFTESGPCGPVPPQVPCPLWKDDKYRANLFCPPYLYKSASPTQLATRPAIASPAITSLAWADTFTICTPDAAQVQKVSAIRGAATTHTFDENQRLVPLTFTPASNPDRLLVHAPASPDHAPPGYYMVFVVGSADGPDVPSIARWVRLGVSTGRDTCDTVVPAAPASLTATCEPGTQDTWRIQFVAPADDGTLAASGSVKDYDVRIHNAPITAANWDAAAQLSPPAPGGPGTVQLTLPFTITERSYVRVKALDDNLGLSSMSNQVTLPFPTDCSGFAGGGGGGGGSNAQRAAEGSRLQPAPGTNPVTENSLLHASELGQATTDHLRLADAGSLAGGRMSAVVRAQQGSAAVLDRVRILAVDHAPDARAFVAGGMPLTGTLAPATRALDATGADVTAMLDGSGEPLFGDAGATVTVDLPGDPGTAGPIVLEASGQGGSEGGILVQVPDAEGRFVTVGRVLPRRQFDAQAVDSVLGGTVRLEFLGPHAVRSIGRLTPSSVPATTQWLAAVSAESEVLGDVAGSLSDQDVVAVPLVGPDAIALSFESPEITPGLVRTSFLVVDGTPLAPQQVFDAATRAQQATAPVPARFALRQGHPNPSSSAASIRFDLPTGQVLRLEMLDAQGRRVRTLSRAYHPAGEHTVTWDLRDGAGRRVGPGIHFCRLVAGSSHETIKVVVMSYRRAAS